MRRARWTPDLPLAVALVLCLPIVVLLGLLFFWPLGRVIGLSFTQPEAGFGNYSDFFASSADVNALLRTLGVSAAVTAVTVPLGAIICAPRARELSASGSGPGRSSRFG